MQQVAFANYPNELALPINTGMPLIRLSSMRLAASATELSGSIVIRRRVMTSAAFILSSVANAFTGPCSAGSRCWQK